MDSITYSIGEQLYAVLSKLTIAEWAIIVQFTMLSIEVFVRLTPSTKDDSIHNKIKEILDIIIPNRRSDGGMFK